MRSEQDSAEFRVQGAERATTLQGETAKIRTDNCGTLYLTLNLNPETRNICQMFIHLGKAGGCQTCLLNGIARLASYAMMHYNMPASEVARMLKGLHCYFPTYQDGEIYPSCLALVAERLTTETQRTQRRVRRQECLHHEEEMI